MNKGILIFSLLIFVFCIGCAAAATVDSGTDGQLCKWGDEKKVFSEAPLASSPDRDIKVISERHLTFDHNDFKRVFSEASLASSPDRDIKVISERHLIFNHNDHKRVFSESPLTSGGGSSGSYKDLDNGGKKPTPHQFSNGPLTSGGGSSGSYKDLDNGGNKPRPQQ